MAEENGAPQGMLGGHVVALSMMNAAITAQIGTMVALEVPATDIMNLLIEHTGKLMSLIDPEQTRNAILGEIRQNLPGVVNRHYEARMTTAGGVRLPDAGVRMQ